MTNSSSTLHVHSGHLILFIGWLVFFIGVVVARQLYAPAPPTDSSTGQVAALPSTAGFGGTGPADRELLRASLFAAGAIGAAVAGISSLLSVNHRYPQTFLDSSVAVSIAAAYLCVAGCLLLRPTGGTLVGAAVTTAAALALLVTELAAGNGFALMSPIAPVGLAVGGVVAICGPAAAASLEHRSNAEHISV
ncbi:MAG: hypothetical protein JWN95_3440 [Frankiales bacterium]|nr:hypothetical protein [Frankiales bacterium]